jgi:tRNA pseudouridine(55) synthase
MILNLWKPYGISSSQFVLDIKKIGDYKSICFTGRLDPLAQGVMILLTDDDVKSVSNYLSSDKVYSFKLILGISTISHDPMSEIKDIKDMSYFLSLYKVDIEKYLEEFKKTYLKQEFPLVSSKTVLHNGIRKPLWWFYKNGVKREEIVLPIKDIKIYEYDVNGISYINSVDMFNSFIERIELIQDEKIKSDLITEKWIEMYNDLIIKYPTNKFIQIDLKMKVSSGFYIRKFCEDFGEYIGVPALAFDITRDEVI